MRALSIEDMEIVSGGLTEGDALALGTGLGSAVWVGVGEYFGVSTAQATLLAGIGAAYGAGITSAAIIG